jgi:lipopolysaccharide transport system ATP-binding protein
MPFVHLIRLLKLSESRPAGHRQAVDARLCDREGEASSLTRVKSLVVEGVSKRYFVPTPQPKAITRMSRLARLRYRLSNLFSGDFSGQTELWALKDVSFDVDHGSVLGIIGANGAGKSTLLKVLARVVHPTEGRVRGRGRVVSLIELGAGFDDEMSARENIFMNAAMNGVPRAVATRRFDEIIAFAELEDAVDTELQFYSSGMYLRLAFSVAINMDPDILLADEILAVGDMVFQERCLQKVRELAAERGLTVLFVSHDMEAVSRICERVIWLNSGRLHADGTAQDVIAGYQNAAWDLLAAGRPTDAAAGSRSCRYGEILEVKLLSADGREIGSPPRSEDVYVRIRFRTMNSTLRARCSVDLLSKGVLVLRSAQPEYVRVGPDMSCEGLVRIPANLLADRTYSINAGVTIIKGGGDYYRLGINKALTFMVYGEDGSAPGGPNGIINPTLDWSFLEEPLVVRA